MAPHEQRITARIVASGNPDNVGKVISRPAFYELFLINESDHDLASVVLTAASCGGEGGRSVALRRSAVRLGELKRGRASLLEQLDIEGIDVVFRYGLKLRFVDGCSVTAALRLASATALRDGEYRYFRALKTTAASFSLQAAGDAD